MNLVWLVEGACRHITARVKQIGRLLFRCRSRPFALLFFGNELLEEFAVFEFGDAG